MVVYQLAKFCISLVVGAGGASAQSEQLRCRWKGTCFDFHARIVGRVLLGGRRGKIAGKGVINAGQNELCIVRILIRN